MYIDPNKKQINCSHLQLRGQHYLRIVLIDDRLSVLLPSLFYIKIIE